MADDPADVKPRLQHAAANHHNSHRLTAPSTLSAPLKLDEGYSDESRSPLDRVANDVMSLPDWLLAQSETDRAELAYSLLRTLRTSSLAAIVDRVTPLLHMDPVLKLPPEITFEIFAYLDSQTLLTASLASRAWRDRVCDPRLWRNLYTTEGWRINIDAVRAYEDEHSRLPSPQSRKSRSRYADSDLGEPKQKKRVPPTWLDSRVNDLLDDKAAVLAEADPEGDHVMSDAADRALPPGNAPVVDPEDTRLSSPETSRTISHGRASASHNSSSPVSSPLLLRMPNGAAKINWLYLYRQRRRLEENWGRGRFTNFQLPHPAHMDECHQDFVYTIQFSGKWLVSGSRDKTIRVWDLTTQRLWYPPLVGHTKSVLCLQFDADSGEDIIISGGSDMSVIVWRFSTGEKLQQIARAHDDSVLNLQYDKRYLVTGSKDKLIKVWNRTTLIPTDKDYPQVHHHSSGVSYPAYIIDTSEVPSPVIEANLARSQIQPLAPYSLLMTLAGHGTAVNAIQMGETEIVSASGDRMIKVWNLRNGACLKTLGGHKKGIACVQFDGRRIISGGNDNSVRIFDHASGAEVAILQGHDNLVRTVQAGFGDPPGAEESMRLEALAVENDFFEAQRTGANVDLGPRAMRRAGHRQDTTGSRNPRDIGALGARIPPGGGGSRWARIVSGSYDENVIVWKKDKQHRWIPSQKLSYKAAVENAQATGCSSSSSSRRSSRDNSRTREARSRGEGATQTQRHGLGDRDRHRDREREREREPERQADDAHHRPHRQHRHSHPHPPRVFKLQFDARKIICGSTDPIIVGWDFAGLDEDLREASQFFTSL